MDEDGSGALDDAALCRRYAEVLRCAELVLFSKDTTVAGGSAVLDKYLVVKSSLLPVEALAGVQVRPTRADVEPGHRKGGSNLAVKEREEHERALRALREANREQERRIAELRAALLDSRSRFERAVRHAVDEARKAHVVEIKRLERENRMLEERMGDAERVRDALCARHADVFPDGRDVGLDVFLQDVMARIGELEGRQLAKKREEEAVVGVRGHTESAPMRALTLEVADDLDALARDFDSLHEAVQRAADRQGNLTAEQLLE